jgi:hypothetical protein
LVPAVAGGGYLTAYNQSNKIFVLFIGKTPDFGDSLSAQGTKGVQNENTN